MNTNQKLTKIINAIEAKMMTDDRVEQLNEMFDSGATVEDMEKWVTAHIEKLPEGPKKDLGKVLMADELIKRLEEMKTDLPRNR
jgi:hypothetical protein